MSYNIRNHVRKVCRFSLQFTQLVALNKPNCFLFILASGEETQHVLADALWVRRTLCRFDFWPNYHFKGSASQSCRLKEASRGQAESRGVYLACACCAPEALLALDVFLAGEGEQMETPLTGGLEGGYFHQTTADTFSLSRMPGVARIASLILSGE